MLQRLRLVAMPRLLVLLLASFAVSLLLTHLPVRWTLMIGEEQLPPSITSDLYLSEQGNGRVFRQSRPVTRLPLPPYAGAARLELVALSNNLAPIELIIGKHRVFHRQPAPGFRRYSLLIPDDAQASSSGIELRTQPLLEHNSSGREPGPPAPFGLLPESERLVSAVVAPRCAVDDRGACCSWCFSAD